MNVRLARMSILFFFLFYFCCLTELFTILESQNPWIGELSVVEKRRSTDFQALKL